MASTATRKQGASPRQRAWWLVALALTACACHAPEKYVYVGDAPRNEAVAITNQYGSTIFPGDILYIHISSRTPEAVIPFNEETNKAVYRSGRTAINSSRGAQGYTVAQDGTIAFPVLGRIPAAGLTYEGLARDLESRLVERRYVKDPVASVELMNFHVTVIGEVAAPRVLPVKGTRITIFEALAQCGDVTLKGKRDNVLVVRFEGEKVSVDSIDLTSRQALVSPCYYLQQGDIVYVEPTKRRKRDATLDEDWPHYISMAANTLRIAYILVYRYAYDPATRVR